MSDWKERARRVLMGRALAHEAKWAAGQSSTDAEDVAAWAAEFESIAREAREQVAAMIEHDELSVAGEQPLKDCGLPDAIRALSGRAHE